MTRSTDLLNSLRRPRMLVRAARFGLSDYNRDRDLKKLMNTVAAPSPQRAVDGLLQQEAAMEITRQSGEASYSISRHIEVLIALMAELRLLPQGPKQA